MTKQTKTPKLEQDYSNGKLKMKLRILAFIFFILLIGCAKTENYGIKNLTLKEANPLQKAFETANADRDVRALLQGRSYSVEVKKADDNEKASMPNVYSGLAGNLYRVDYKSGNYGLIVITDEKKVCYGANRK